MKVVPDGDEGDAEEEAEGSPEVCHLFKKILKFHFEDRTLLSVIFQFLKKRKIETCKRKIFSCREIIPYQGLNWVDQLLSLDICSCGDRPDRKGDQTTRIEHRWQSFQKCYFEQRCFVCTLNLIN